ncbi:MAG: hypothetical protein M3410_08615 [Acidobacteriota bacterium]|nr:hypothetical protein [Acidobacteriota bacterium]
MIKIQTSARNPLRSLWRGTWRSWCIGGFALGLICAFAVHSTAQIRVSPDGVNVSTQTPTIAFLTFGNLSNQKPAEATWCGELISATPDLGLKCNPATIFGVIPARYDRPTQSGTSAYTDIMTLPASVSRRAYQAAAGGATSSFFFVRRFVSTVGGPDEFVVVTCRMAGGMAGSPFSLTDVEIGFSGVDKPILFSRLGEKLPQIEAEITYTGTGRLKGRWEVVMPGEEPPAARDLLTEATLPIEQRGTQRRYTQLERFNIFLPARRNYTLRGPDPDKLPVRVAGEYMVLLRVEASDDVGAVSDLSQVGAGPGVVESGAVSGIPMPVLRYFVGAGAVATLNQLTPAADRIFGPMGVIDFAWMDVERAHLYLLEITDTTGKSVLSALLSPGMGTYRAPSWLRERSGAGELRWRVIALNETGQQLAESSWRNLRFSEAAAGAEKPNP